MNPDADGASVLGLQMQGGELQRLSPTATKEEQSAVLNDIIDKLNSLLKAQVFSDNSSKRYIQGYAAGRWPGGDFGIAISAEGADVTSVPFEDLIFAWDFSTNRQYIRGGVQTYYDKDTGKTALQVGEMDDKNMAFKTFDTAGVPIGLFGQSPKDRHSGDWVVAPGENVDTELKWVDPDL